jgi:hypothetical protein
MLGAEVHDGPPMMVKRNYYRRVARHSAVPFAGYGPAMAGMYRAFLHGLHRSGTPSCCASAAGECPRSTTEADNVAAGIETSADELPTLSVGAVRAIA